MIRNFLLPRLLLSHGLFHLCLTLSQVRIVSGRLGRKGDGDDDDGDDDGSDDSEGESRAGGGAMMNNMNSGMGMVSVFYRDHSFSRSETRGISGCYGIISFS